MPLETKKLLVGAVVAVSAGGMTGCASVWDPETTSTLIVETAPIVRDALAPEDQSGFELQEPNNDDTDGPPDPTTAKTGGKGEKPPEKSLVDRAKAKIPRIK